MMRSAIVTVTCWFSLVWAVSAAEEPAGRTKRVYLMGSSLTDQVKYQALAESRGYSHIWGNHGIPGAPIRVIWECRDSDRGRQPFGASGKALQEFTWDAVTLEPRAQYDQDLEAACKYIDYTLKNGNLIFATRTKLYLSTDNLQSYRQVSVKDVDGADYVPHTPQNPEQPGWYFHPLDGVHTYPLKS